MPARYLTGTGSKAGQAAITRARRERRVQFVFGECVLDTGRRELSRGSEPVAVGPQVFDLLIHLIENRDRVVSKDELFDVIWRGRTISESTLTSHVNFARRAIGDNGEEQRLIRTISRKGFRFVGDVREAPSLGAEKSKVAEAGPSHLNITSLGALALPDQPSVAVLPFLNLSGDPDQDYFADGVVEDIIGALSRMRWLFVIARNSSFTYKGRAVDVKQVGRELGVRYVLEGSVRKAGNRVRVTGQLIDATAGAHLWAERFDSTLEDIFDLHDELATSVVGAIAPQLERAEIQRAKHKPTDKLDAYDYYLRGMASFHQGNQEGMNEALPLFYRAIERDPGFASAYAMAAACLFWSKFNGWVADRSQVMSEGARLAHRAIELGKDDAVALARGGHALANFVGDLDGGIALIDKALLLNPNLATAWFLGGFVQIMRGEPDNAIERLAYAMRSSPLDSEMYRMQCGTALAHLCAGRFDEAAPWAEKALRDLPSFLIAVCIIAASHAFAGRMDEAQRAIQNLRRLDPALRLSNLKDWLLFHRPEYLTTLSDGLRRAGLPE
jgi:TolB-like protein/tetratricopeptide (TPR) repeat protein